MNRYMCGFDDVDVTGLGFEMVVGGVPTIEDTGRTGKCIRFPNSGQYAYTVCSPEGQATLYFGFAMRPATLGGIIAAVGDGNCTHVVFQLNSDGTISAYRNVYANISFTSGAGTLLCTSTAKFSQNSWNYFEGKVTLGDAPNGAIAMRFNGGVSDDPTGTATGLDTRQNTNGGTTLLSWVGITGTNLVGNHDYDDFWVNDTQGTVCNGFMGDQRIDFHLPKGDGANSAWTPSTGTSHYGTVDENPPNTADYNGTSTLNAVDTLDVEDFKNGGADINAIQMTMVAQKSDAGSCAIQAVIREGGVDTASGVSSYPMISWGAIFQNYSLAVGDAKRSAAGFNAAEFGYKKVA